MNKTITKIIKLTATAAAVATALTGCCLFGNGNKDCCCNSSRDCCGTCGKPPCECRCTPKCCGHKTHGMNASVTLGAGTDGITVDTATNAGAHGTNAGFTADAGRTGVAGSANGSLH